MVLVWNFEVGTKTKLFQFSHIFNDSDLENLASLVKTQNLREKIIKQTKR